MNMLYLGLALFLLLHLVPIYARPVRDRVAAMIGVLVYRILFALASLGGLILVVQGWKAAVPSVCYTPPVWGMHVTPLFVLFGFILFFAARAPTNIKRLIRNPQLTGVFLWASGHLFSNGDSRGIALFGSFALWSLIAIWGTNRRDGAWVKPEKQPLIKDIITVAIGLVLFLVFMLWLHVRLIGISPMPSA